MILRKPYAFLIKNFKLIHLFISGLVLYLIYKTNNILNFFKDYISDDISKIDSSNYVSIFIYLSLFLIIGLSISMIVLMRKKDKPLLFYIFTIIGYSIIFAGFVYISSILNTLEFNLLDRKTISLARDITRFMLIGQWIFLIPYVIRTLGFDIKKFDFKKDMQELDILETDNEEFELLSPVDMKKVEKFGRRRIRELYYYYVENKAFILIILAIVLFIGSIFIISNIDFATLKKYDENEIIKLDNFYTLKVEESYMTTKSDSGKNIAINDNFYLIVKFNINSMFNKDFNLDTNKFLVSIKNKEFIPIKTHYNYFKSYGIGYKNQDISFNDNKSYILVYNIPNEYKNKKMVLEYNYRYDNSKKEPKIIKKIVKLKPKKNK